MTREELKEHCIKEIKMCEMWARLKGEETHRKLYEEHKLILELLEHEPKIKVLDRDEVIRKLGTVDIYEASAWITLLKDLEYLGMKICEVEE